MLYPTGNAAVVLRFHGFCEVAATLRHEAIIAAGNDASKKRNRIS
jgi:hypothetical protein